MMETLLFGFDGISFKLYDILISEATKEQQAERLEHVLSKLDSTGLNLKKGRGKFAVSEAIFIGRRIHASGVHTTPYKIKSTMDATEPTEKTELQPFLCCSHFITASSRTELQSLQSSTS